MASITGNEEEVQLHLSPRHMTSSSTLSRVPSNGSSIGSGASPARPPKSDQRRSSASPEAIIQHGIAQQLSKSIENKRRSKSSRPTSPDSLTGVGVGATATDAGNRSSILSVSTSTPVLPSIKAGSTPVTPSGTDNTYQSDFPSQSFDLGSVHESSISASASTSSTLQRDLSRSSTADILTSTLDSYHGEMSRQNSSASAASSSRYTSSGPPSPSMSAKPVAKFTAGLEHQLSPSLGPLRIKSTTGSKTTVIKPNKKKSKTNLAGRPSYSGGISSEDIFGSSSANDSNDDAISDTNSRSSSRARSFTLSTRKAQKHPSQGVSSADVFGNTTNIPSSTSPKSPSLSSMLTGLRKHSSRSESRSSSPAGQVRSASRTSSHPSISNTSESASASVSEQESISSDRSKNGSGGKRRHRFSDVLRRKTDAERAEEEEHLRTLAELRLRALALASGADDPSSSSSSSPSRGDAKTNAEMLVRDMQRHRLSRANTVSSTYTSEGEGRNDDTIMSPGIPMVRQRSSSQSSYGDEGQEALSGPTLPSTSASAAERPSADVPMDADYSDEENAVRKSFMDTGRRATLMPTSSYSSLSQYAQEEIIPSNVSGDASHLVDAHDDEEDRRKRALLLAEDRRRSTLTPSTATAPSPMKTVAAKNRLSKDIAASAGTEADVDDDDNPLQNSILQRRRSTVKAEPVSPTGSYQRGLRASASRSSLKRPGSRDSSSSARSQTSPKTSAIILPLTRPRNQSHSSSHSIQSLSRAEVIVPPVRSSSHTEVSGAIFGRPLGQRSDSQNSLFAYGTYGFNKPTYSRSNSASAELNAATSAFSVVSRHEREGATASPAMTGLAQTSLATPSSTDSPDARPGIAQVVDTGLVATPPLSRRTSADGQRDMNSGSRPPFGHQRSSSDVLAPASGHQRPSIGNHRRSSSTELSAKALPARPANGRQHRSSTSVLQDQQTNRQYTLETARTAALLKRNKPLPAAAVYRDELRACRSAGERAVVYARKINELSTVDSGLLAWLSRTRPTEPSTDDVQWANRRGSAATIHITPNSSSSNHPLRDDNQSEAIFPLRRGSQDVYKARDITQRTPSIAPSTMVPNNIPYPGVYEDSQTLRTSSAMSTHSKMQHSGSSLASAALNAAGLPSLGFFGLGRKSSKRAHSARHYKSSDGAAGLSISGPIQPVSIEHPPPSGSRSVSLRPTGPRPGLSGSSSNGDLQTVNQYNTLPASSSIRSLASIPQGFVTTQPSLQPTLRSQASPLAYGSGQVEQDGLNAMADVLPQASKEVLVKYLDACNGDHLAAISAYFDDQR